ncbi:MAG: HAD family hydrolase [Planctomycetes bacterium]|nr:HAD family hydrolase [Planctomycetota bacterium]
MKIAIDLDNTITASEQSIEFFSVLTNLLITDHKIYIITNQQPNSEQEIAEELDYHNIDYSEIVITADKAQYVRDNNIKILFEDTDEYFLELGKEVTVFKIREDGNFDFSAKKWIGSEKTTKMIDNKRDE